MPAEAASAQPPRLSTEAKWLIAGAVIIAAAFLLHLPQLTRPTLLFDDFQILAKSYTWEATLANLGQTHNEHIMPLGRLSTWLLVQTAGRASLLPLVVSLQGPLVVLVGMLLLFLFVRRELGHPLYGLIAMALFGVTTQYREAVAWFSASFSILALDTMLLALLAAQQWRQTSRKRYIAGAALAAGLAPCWFASGILAGPICALYLALPDNAVPSDACRSSVFQPGFGRRFFAGFVPILGTLAFVAVGLLRKFDDIMHLEHYQGKTASEAIHPLRGLEYTFRSLIDNLVLGSVGIPTVNCPIPWVIFGVGLLGVLGIVWWFLAPNRRLVVLGAVLIFMSYWMIYSARAEWSYEGDYGVSRWGRYQLLPHLGLTLCIAGGVPRWQGWGLISDSADPPEKGTALTGLLLASLLGFLFGCQLPRSFAYFEIPGQNADLRRVDAVDALCRQHHIAAAVARDVLPLFDIAGCGGRVNGWDFLRGSPDPQTVTPDGARRWLAEFIPPPPVP
ncbi:hypothetical protein AYO44_00825 [Planctomycetaceae bacterium SCGC AG-212-F19]|nr:hypothetical protein AYO44_00825 [Planctomycetaceae bacterium SCGC AG-212-F19]